MRTLPPTRSPLLPLAAASVAMLTLGCAPRQTVPALGATVGSPCVIADTTAAAPDTVRVLGTISRNPSGTDCQGQPFHRGAAPAVVVLSVPHDADLRDVLEGRPEGTPQPDVVVSRDASLLDLARRSGGYLIQALPWSATYVLVTAGFDSTPGLPTDTQRDALARNAVTSDTRGALAPFGWLTAPGCARAIPAPAGAPRPVILYSARDAIARELAERLVSLSVTGSPPAWLPVVLATGPTTGPRIAPLPRDSLATALASGHAAAAVMPIARDWTMPCGTRAGLAPPSGAIPLVDARDHVIIRRGSGAGVIISADGTLHVVTRGGQ